MIKFINFSVHTISMFYSMDCTFLANAQGKKKKKVSANKFLKLYISTNSFHMYVFFNGILWNVFINNLFRLLRQRSDHSSASTLTWSIWLDQGSATLGFNPSAATPCGLGK